MKWPKDHITQTQTTLKCGDWTIQNIPMDDRQWWVFLHPPKSTQHHGKSRDRKEDRKEEARKKENMRVRERERENKHESKSKRNERQKGDPENQKEREKKHGTWSEKGKNKANLISNVKDFQDTRIKTMPDFQCQPRLGSSTIRAHTQDAIFVVGHHLRSHCGKAWHECWDYTPVN